MSQNYQQKFDDLQLILNDSNVSQYQHIDHHRQRNDNTNELSSPTNHMNHDDDTDHGNDGNGDDTNEFPNELSSAFASQTFTDTIEGINYNELRTSVSYDNVNQMSHSYGESHVNAWQMNYHESAIYLEEGLNNDKFDFHPKSRDELPAYLLVHNHWFYTLDLLASMLLLSLAILEKPAVTGFKVNEWVHASLELLGLSIVSVELSMKYRWMKLKHFLTHKRTAIKLTVLIIMIIEALVVLIRRDSHFRVTRALRPVFLIDNRYCEGIRRVIRQILQSLPPIIDMLVLLFFFMLLFALFGFYLFSNDPNDIYFTTLERSFISLFVLLTTANYPDVMMPSYAKNRITSLFFIAFLVIHLYFLMNLMLAVVYETFTRIEKDKFRKLLLHRRRACQHAFRLLVTKSSPTQISFKHFEGLIKYYKPRASKLETYLMFKALDSDNLGFVTRNEFYKVYEVLDLSWERSNSFTPWYNDIPSQCFVRFCRCIHSFVSNQWFTIYVYVVIAASGFWQLFEAFLRRNFVDKRGLFDIMASPIAMTFVSLYGIESCLKMIGFGVFRYFKSYWNILDFGVTMTAIMGLTLIDKEIGIPFSFVFIIRSLHLLKLFELKARYRDIMGTFLFIIMKRFGSVSIVVLIVYYFFGIIGMELFSHYNLMNCCRNTSVEQFFAYNPNSTFNGYYYLNNFENIFISYITLFELMVVNNWFILMDGYSIVASEWSRLYFMTFYIVTMVVITIVVAFVLEAFIFRIQYRHKMGDIDKDTMVTIDISLSHEEMDFCSNESPRIRNATLLLRIGDDSNSHVTNHVSNCVKYHGSRIRTKFSFSLKMYNDVIKEWTRKADEEDQRRHERHNTYDDDSIGHSSRRTYSCSY